MKFDIFCNMIMYILQIFSVISNIITALFFLIGSIGNIYYVNKIWPNYMYLICSIFFTIMAFIELIKVIIDIIIKCKITKEIK